LVVHGIHRGQATQQSHAAARHNAFFDGRAGCVQRIFDAGFLFLHLGLGGSPNVDDGDATGELGQAFLQLLFVVIGRGLFDLPANLIHAALDFGAPAVAFDEGGVFLVHRDVLDAAEFFQS
jgi:hypothetical protein